MDLLDCFSFLFCVSGIWQDKVFFEELLVYTHVCFNMILLKAAYPLYFPKVSNFLEKMKKHLKKEKV
jgi:hypothetical protein